MQIRALPKTIIAVLFLSSLVFVNSSAFGSIQGTTFVFLPLVLKQSTPIATATPTLNPPTQTISPPATATATSTPTISPSSTPTPTSSANVLPIGYKLRFDVFEGTVVQSSHEIQLTGTAGTIYPEQVFIVVIMDVKNMDYVSDSVSRFDLALRDSFGRMFDMASLEAHWAAEDQFGLTSVYEDIQPSFVERQVYVFDVAKDSTNLELISKSELVDPTPNLVPSSVVVLNENGSTGNWKYRITEVQKANSLNGDYGVVTAKGTFLVTFVTIKNIGLESGSISRFDFVIQDSLTRQFDMADLEIQWAAEDQYNRTGVYETIQPSFTEDQVYVFDVSPSSSGLLFVPMEPGDAVSLGQ